MAGTSITALQVLYNTAQDYFALLNEWKNKEANAQTLVSELERQVKEHNENNDQVNAEAVAKRLNDAYGKLSEAQSSVKKYADFYKEAQRSYETSKSMLSPAEQVQLTAAQDAETAMKNAEAAQKLTANATTQQKLFMQKSTSYIIIGSVVLVIGTIAFLLYKKYSK